ncbi:MAG: hypothetical protein R2910_05520 [Gemmatimonadales bacterium]
MPPKKRPAKPSPKRRKKPPPIRTARPIYSESRLRALSPDEAHARSRALEGISLMRREGYSLARAAREVGLTSKAVRSWGGPTVRKVGRRYVAKRFDKLVRQMKVTTVRGVISVPIYDSRAASKLGAYHAAVRQALDGNVGALKPFRGKTLRTGGKQAFPFITDMRVLARLYQADVLPDYEIYAL